MNILIKFILKNILEKKLRTFLIVFTIIVSTSLFFAATTMPENMAGVFLKTMEKYVGTSDIIIIAGDEAPTPFFEEPDFNSYQFEYFIPTLDAVALHRGENYQLTTINLIGMELNKMQILNPFNFTLGNTNSLSKNEVVIGSDFSKKHNLKLYNHIDLEILGENYSLRIVGISNTGPFAEDGQGNQFLVSPQLLQSIYSLPDNFVSSIYIKSGQQDPQVIISSLREDFPSFDVDTSIPQDMIDMVTNFIKMPFYIILGLVFFISFFIIYTSFKLIVKERLPITGTFRSLGATKKITNLVLIGETLVYSIIGGTIGIFLGIGILGVISSSLSSSFVENSNGVLVYSKFHIIASLTVGFAITLVSGIAPILSSNNYSVKEIILNMLERPKKNKGFKLYVALFFILFALIAPRLASRNYQLLIVLSALLMSITTISYLIPYLVKLIVTFLEKLYEISLSSIGTLACKNLRGNKNILGSITLLSIGIATLLSINMLSYSVLTEVALAYEKYGNYDVRLQAERINDQVLKEIENIDGVERATGYMMELFVEVEGQDKKLRVLEGITPEYIDFWRLNIPASIIEKLADGKNVIITTVLKEDYGLGVGDNITFNIKGKKETFIIVGVFDSITNDGQYAIMSLDNFKKTFNSEFYTGVFIKGNSDSESLLLTLREKLYHINPSVITLDEQAESNRQMNAMLFIVINAFSVLTLLTGLLGIVNNLLISFIERKRYLAVYRSLGMSKGQIVKLMFIESLTGGIAGSIIGVLGGLLLVVNMPLLVRAIASPVPLHFKGSLLIVAFFAGTLVMVLASISPAVKSSKLNIIESIKYE